MRPAAPPRGLAAAALACCLGLPAGPHGAAQAPRDELTSLVAALFEYVTAYEQTVASLVCEERYEQRVRRHHLGVGTQVSGIGLSPGVTFERRVLLSDYLLVRLPGAASWEPFRDVHTVDGRPVRDREDRLHRLFVAPGSPSPARQAEAIRLESGRYNIGDVVRDINVPTYALGLFRESLRPSFRFSLQGRERVRGLDTRVVGFEETARPTMIRARHDEDSPASGRVWIDAATGTLVRTRLETRSEALRTRIDVDYALDADLGFWVPVEMTETHALPGQTVEGKATYSRFRQFKVETTEVIGPPRS